MTDRADARARHARAVPGDLRDPALGDDHDHADARAGRRHAHLLVFVLHQLRRAARQGGDARAAPGVRHAARVRAAARPPQRTGASMPRSSARAPTSAWARTTSTCTTSGRSRAWARSRTARSEHLGTSDKVIMANRRTLLKAIETVRAGGRRRWRSMPTRRRALTGPDTIDCIAPAAEWDAFWREPRRPKRAGAPWPPRDGGAGRADRRCRAVRGRR